MFFSLIIPVFNRPDEIRELLESIVIQDFNSEFEVVIVEDGSTINCLDVVNTFSSQLDILYLSKSNTGPGDSRNYGMKLAKGDYFLIFDSDCILPKHYLSTVYFSLNQNFTHCFGGPDKALDSFSNVQKAINYSMTSFFTTGGVRGGSEILGKFQPRSFNMGISKHAIELSKGFGNIHPGEDPDLTFRLWKLDFKTKLIQNAFVYHKRRIDWEKFHNQLFKFGIVRPILNSWHPEFTRMSYFLPLFFVLILDISVLLVFFEIYFPILIFGIYFALIFVHSSALNNNLKIGGLSVFATLIQFYAYSYGFIQSFIQIQILKKNPEKVFPNLFFKK